MFSVFGVLEKSEVPVHRSEEIAQYKGLLCKLEDLTLTHSTYIKEKK